MDESQTNIILLSIDALRADHLSFQNYNRETSPTIDKLAKKYVNFTNAFSASSHTREAIPALLTGKFPDRAVNNSYNLSTVTIASHLNKSGYETGGFHSNPFVSRAFGFDDGFEIFDDDLYLGQNKIIAFAQRAYDKLRNRHYARADEINERSLKWLDSLNDEPFFLWNHYMDVHGPYAPPTQHRYFVSDKISDKKSQKLYKRSIKSPESITEEEREMLINRYDSEIKYIDNQLQYLFKELKKRELFEKSMVILTADHGEVFGEYGYYEHPRYPYRELLHVPLLISPPQKYQIKYTNPVSTLDIVPTILKESNLSYNNMDGEPLQTRWRTPERCSDEYRFGQASTKNDNGHWVRRYGIHSKKENEIIEINLSEGGDPVCIYSSHSNKELSETLTKHANNRIKKSTNREDDSEMNDTADEINDRLEALGYLER